MTTLASPLTEQSALQLAAAIRGKQTSSLEAVEAHLRRIEAVNPALNAVVQLDADGARASARAADAALARGESLGALHGVPMTIKDNLDTAGVVSTGGTRGRAAFVPAEDATVVARLRAAGAILMGKTNTPELTLAYETDNSVYGRTNNPHDSSRTCGGSSGGAAAIVAAFGSPFDIGSDTGGSIRFPSHCCGTAGLRPTSGRVPRTGHILPPGGPFDRLTQLGPIARTVDDLAAILPIIAGPDGRDPETAPVSVASHRAVTIAGLRIAMFTDNGVAPATPGVADAVRAAAKTLADAGARVTERRPDGIQQTPEIFLTLFACDGGAGIQMLLNMYGTTEPSPQIQGLLDTFKATQMSAADAVGLMFRWDIFRASMLAFMQDVDAILCPVAATPAMPHGFFSTPEGFAACSYMQTFSLTGWPVAAVRAGTAEGLPVGVQVATAPWREDVALALAARIRGEA